MLAVGASEYVARELILGRSYHIYPSAQVLLKTQTAQGKGARGATLSTSPTPPWTKRIFKLYYNSSHSSCVQILWEGT